MEPAFLSNSEAAKDVRMIQLRHDARFALKPLDEVFVGGEVFEQDLDGNVTFKALLIALVNFAHASGAEAFDQLVLPKPVEFFGLGCGLCWRPHAFWATGPDGSLGRGRGLCLLRYLSRENEVAVRQRL